jgi:hypothetical protein
LGWRTLEGQSHKQKAGVDHGRRGAVTGGKQMDGFCAVSGLHANRNSMDNGRRCCRAEWYSSRQIPSTGRWAVAVAAMVAAPVVVARVAAVRRARSAAVRNPVAAVAGQQMAVAAG